MLEYLSNLPEWAKWLSGVAGVALTYLIPGLRFLWLILYKTLTSKRMLIKAIIYLGDRAVDDEKINFWDAAWIDVRKALIKALNK